MTSTEARRRRRRLGLAIGLALAVFAIVFAWRLFTSSAGALARAPYVVAPASRYASWDDVFREAPRVRWMPLDTGEVGVTRRAMLRRDAADAGGPCDDPTAPALRVFAHLVRHPVHGDVLVDSGLDDSFTTASYGNIRWPAWWILAVLMDAPYRQERDADVAAQLSREGAHVRRVFFTHLHMDHTAGVPALPADVQLVTGPAEADDGVGVFGFGHFRGDAVLHELDFTDAPDLPPLGPAIDLLGDGSFWAVSTPGHSRGHVSFVVNAEQGPVLLVGDASHFACAFDHGIGPAGPDAEHEGVAQASLDRLRAFAARYAGVTVFTGHESPPRPRG